MKIAIRVLLVLAVATFLLPESGEASVVFKPGKKPEYVGPGGVEEELSGDAVDLFQIGQAAENEGNYKRAVRAYKVSSNAIPRTRLPRKRFIGPRNYRNNSTISLQLRVHFHS